MLRIMRLVLGEEWCVRGEVKSLLKPLDMAEGLVKDLLVKCMAQFGEGLEVVLSCRMTLQYCLGEVLALVEEMKDCHLVRLLLAMEVVIWVVRSAMVLEGP